jgi:hypothetical protein
MNEKVKLSECSLGDVVRSVINNDAFADSTIINITPEFVTLFRPYVHTSDFTYTGGIIPYVGFEKWDAPLTMDVVMVYKCRTRFK